jgi:hypothetical protein
MTPGLPRLFAAASLAALVVGCVPVSSPPVISPRATPAVWGGLGVGVGSAGFMAQMDVSRVKTDRLLRARWNGHTNMGGTWSGEPEENVSELGILTGRGGICCGGNWGAYALGGGLVTGSVGPAPAEEFTTVGLAGEAFLVSARFPHLAISMLGNANVKKSFIAVNLSILLGRMPFNTMAPPVRARFPRR